MLINQRASPSFYIGVQPPLEYYPYCMNHYLMVIDCIQQYLIHQLGVVKSSWLPAKIVAYLVNIRRLLCLAFLYAWTLKIKYP